LSYVRTRYRGMGASPVQVVGTVSQLGTPVATAGISSALASPGTGLILGMTPALAVPIIGAALAAITFAAIKLIQNSGCGPTCIQATQYANQSATLMQQNRDAYLALPTPRPRTAQLQALANFDALWAQLVKLCSDPALGNAGKRCISERQPGGKYDDAKFNRDPIANDPNVVDDTQAALPGPLANLLPAGAAGSSLLPLLALAALVVVGVMVL
jgi:hypothetical protein